MIGGLIKSLDPILPDLPRLAHGASAAASFRGSLSLSEARSCRLGMAGVALNGRYTTGIPREKFYPLVNIQKTMERSTIFDGKIHYFNGHFQ